MPQIFHPSTNTLSRLSIFGALFLVLGLVWLSYEITRSNYVTGVGAVFDQPVPFSHEHHVGGLGIECRYCHESVERSAFAGIPATKTCMTCHSQIWTDSAVLQAVRASFRTGVPLEWTRIHDLADFVYFDHSIHIAKGVGCVTCHGEVDRMPLTWKTQSLQMEWCLECHREPERYVRPREAVYDSRWVPEGDREALGRELVARYHIESLTTCSTCHR
ncbi:MAG: cytochrome c3 family protein [Vicinamibacteria bacterium]